MRISAEKRVKKLGKRAGRWGRGRAKDEVNKSNGSMPDLNPKERKRIYQQRWRANRKKPVTGHLEANFCPRCGYNMQLLKIALAAASKL